MIIDCISDLHGFYPKLNGGDLLIIAGDLTARDEHSEHSDFCEWLDVQPYDTKIVISGNHDNNICTDSIKCLRNSFYLCDSGIEFEGLKIWGSPWTKTFTGINPRCKAFTVDTEKELEEKWKLIPEDVDILVTHSPPFLVLDSCINKKDGKYHNVGSESLSKHLDKIRPKLCVYGHIHENGGRIDKYIYGKNKGETICVNCSHVNEYYKPVNKPMRIEV